MSCRAVKVLAHVVTFCVGCGAAYFGVFGDQTARETASIALSGLIFYAAVFAFLFVVGLVVIPSQIHAQSEAEKAALTANSEALAKQLERELSDQETFDLLKDWLASGQSLFRSREVPEGLKGSAWREASYNW